MLYVSSVIMDVCAVLWRFKLILLLPSLTKILHRLAKFVLEVSYVEVSLVEVWTSNVDGEAIRAARIPSSRPGPQETVRSLHKMHREIIKFHFGRIHTRCGLCSKAAAHTYNVFVLNGNIYTPTLLSYGPIILLQRTRSLNIIYCLLSPYLFIV